jgi:hypothetical protein
MQIRLLLRYMVTKPICKEQQVVLHTVVMLWYTV